MKFKIGDEITIKSVNEIKNLKSLGLYWFILRMEKYCELTYIIKSIDHIDSNYVILDIKNINEYKWHHEWIKHKYGNWFSDKDFMI